MLTGSGMSAARALSAAEQRKTNHAFSPGTWIARGEDPTFHTRAPLHSTGSIHRVLEVRQRGEVADTCNPAFRRGPPA